jgi:hypothetical protein
VDGALLGMLEIERMRQSELVKKLMRPKKEP